VYGCEYVDVCNCNFTDPSVCCELSDGTYGTMSLSACTELEGTSVPTQNCGPDNPDPPDPPCVPPPPCQTSCAHCTWEWVVVYEEDPETAEPIEAGGHWLLTGSLCGPDDLCCPDSLIEGVADGTFMTETIDFGCVFREECDCGIGSPTGPPTGDPDIDDHNPGDPGNPCLGTCWWVWQNNEWVIGTGAYYPNSCADGCICGGWPGISGPPPNSMGALLGFCYSSLDESCDECEWTWTSNDGQYHVDPPFDGKWLLTWNRCGGEDSLCCPRPSELVDSIPPTFGDLGESEYYDCTLHPNCDCDES